VICARIVDGAAMERIGALSDNFASVRFADGYAHDDLDALLADVDLGVIPVLWEDNLPQVAIEMHARHIPLLTSDLGGARELGRCPDLVFAADDPDSFADRIAAVLEGEIDLHGYWESAMSPYSMDDHVSQLMQVYDAPPRAPALLPSMPGADPEIRPAMPGQEAGDEADIAGDASTWSA
jgi:glycosyltransferase involved in cell wall biosynthesis